MTSSVERRFGRFRAADERVAGGRPGATETAARPESGLPPFNRFAILVGGVLFAVLMVYSTRYGYDRDDLYFLDMARHLQASYPDQPVFSPLIAWVSLQMFGVSLAGLHLWPALAAWATVVVSALTAREFGGGRRAQLVAAAGAATAPMLLAEVHLFGPTAFDILAWAGLALVVVRVERAGDPRWWLAGGLILGLGLANKHSVGLFAAALLIGALLSGGHRMVLNRWFAAGIVIALAFTIPDIWWQAQHHWATITMTRGINREDGGPGTIADMIFGQFAVTSLVFVGVWIAGLLFLWRSRRPLWRALVWAYGLLFVLFALTAGTKDYYLAGAYMYLVAAGAVAIDGWLAARPGRLRNLMVFNGVCVAMVLWTVLPLLPPADVGYASDINPGLAETVGWPQLVGTVRRVWTSLPARERANGVIFTADYGEAGAINVMDRPDGLPMAVSGHNSYWWWGPGNPHATTVVAVTPGPDTGAPEDAIDYGAYLGRFFTSVKVAATLSNPYGLHNQEWGGHVYVCTGPRQPWGQVWPRLRHYD
jgi:hypothetical protein